MFIETLYDLNRNFAEARAKRYVTNRLLLPESDYKACVQNSGKRHRTIVSLLSFAIYSFGDNR
jgi:hypothetical protein